MKLNEYLKEIKLHDEIAKEFVNVYKGNGIEISKDEDDDFCLISIYADGKSFTFDLETKEIEPATSQTLPDNLNEILQTKIK